VTQHSSVTRLSLLDVANHHEIDTASTPIITSHATASAAMSNPLAEYLSAIEARDVREKAHVEYINACKCHVKHGINTCVASEGFLRNSVDHMKTPSLLIGLRRWRTSLKLP
jgi:hypothetical protein